ncbi:MAG: Phosphoenolpyruvate synthase [Anaerolineales bacterium]|nr:Phosphoenolpyruvate synthase [Anaerolineales bacterium]
MTFIRWFGEITQQDIGLAGGKGANLGELTRAGFPVPPGFVITTDAYRAFVETNDLQARILELARAARADAPTSAEDASRAIGQLFEHGDIPEEVAGEILNTYHDMSRRLCLIR